MIQMRWFESYSYKGAIDYANEFLSANSVKYIDIKLDGDKALLIYEIVPNRREPSLEGRGRR